MLPDQPTDRWVPAETTTHQDHVIAHVLGATVLGYFVYDESLHLFLDMGFVWTIYLDGQMVLLPQVMAISELAIPTELKATLNREIELLGREHDAASLQHIIRAPVECQIAEVSFWANDNLRRVLLAGEPASLMIETSLATAEIQISGE